MTAADVTDAYGLTPMQQGMLYHYLSSPQSGVDVEQVVCDADESFNVEFLNDAWQLVVRRHPALRTSLRWEGVEEPVQQVHSSIAIDCDVARWETDDDAEVETQLRALLQQDRLRGFPLDRAPLMRLAIRLIGESRSILVWSFSHILLDGRSFAQVLSEVFAVYDARRGGTAVELPPVREYRRHIEHLQTLDAAGVESYWRSKLAGFSASTPPPGQAAGDGEIIGAAARGERELKLSAAITERLKETAAERGLSVNTFVQAAWALLLARWSANGDVVFGTVRACRRSSVPHAESIVGTFINTVPTRIIVDDRRRVLDWLLDVRAAERETWKYENAPLVDVQRWSAVPHNQPLFHSLLVFDNFELDEHLRSQGGLWAGRRVRLYEQTNVPLTVYGYAGSRLRLAIAFDAARFQSSAIDSLLGQLATTIERLCEHLDAEVGDISLMSSAEQRLVVDRWNETSTDYPRNACVPELFQAQVGRTPQAVAAAFEQDELTYAELNARSNQLASRLRKLGVGPDVLVGVYVERSLDMLVAILAVQKAGGAYVPLDPGFPPNRISMIMDDAGADVIVTQAHLAVLLPPGRGTVIRIDADWPTIAQEPEENLEATASPPNLAYVIYTSGSTGRPKGVMVEHRNVVSFFAGMDQRVPHDADKAGAWLAVTSLSFDISVLELFWTLCRGFKVVLYSDRRRVGGQPAAAPAAPMRFSMFYFSSDESEQSRDKYRLLIEGSKYADQNGFVAVSTPERHFHAFGGLYPNPAVTGAAVAAITSRVQIRAGSVVLPLHHPIRVAEEWALVDQLSHGRAGISFASGWQPVDFVIRPEAYADRHKRLFEDIEVVRKLWRGDAIEFPDPTGVMRPIRTLPRPVQKQLPCWVTTAGSLDTWRSAGEIGANVLTHLLGQSVDEVADKIRAYRAAYQSSGRPGDGYVTLMLHTFVGDDLDAVRATVREPMKRYLASALSLVKGVAESWPAFKRRAGSDVAAAEFDLNGLTDEEMESLLEFSFERYFSTSGLFGTPRQCLELVRQLRSIGVDEIACLIDFGVDADAVIAHFGHLNEVRQLAEAEASLTLPEFAPPTDDETIGALIRRHGVTHMQCTPSMASMIVADEPARAAMRNLKVLLIGGEAFPTPLASELHASTNAAIINMYGPTETTIWSSTHVVGGGEPSIPIGRPIANTQLYILDSRLRPTPLGIVGELYIGGDGVTRGYHNRPDLTAERFTPNPFVGETSARMYRTGDLARFRHDGAVEFLGRADDQVKVRGYRIELGEIETALTGHPLIREAVVIAREDSPGEKRLVAYYIGDATRPIDEGDLRSLLRERLPDYMVPSRFVALASFPQTPNRKVDRKALPAPDRGTPAPANSVVRATPPAGAAEAKIAAIWTDVLGIASAGRDDNFFDLGGHSLLAIKVHRRLKDAFERDIAMADLFRFPTVKSLAAYLGAATDESSPDHSQQRGSARREMLMRRHRTPIQRAPDRDEESVP